MWEPSTSSFDYVTEDRTDKTFYSYAYVEKVTVGDTFTNFDTTIGSNWYSAWAEFVEVTGVAYSNYTLPLYAKICDLSNPNDCF